MKISVDDKELFSLNETQKKVIKDYVSEDIFEPDMRRRLEWVIMHLYDNAFEMLKNNWYPILKSRGIKLLPTDNDEFAELVFSQPEYKSKQERDKGNI